MILSHALSRKLFPGASLSIPPGTMIRASYEQGIKERNQRELEMMLEPRAMESSVWLCSQTLSKSSVSMMGGAWAHCTHPH